MDVIGAESRRIRLKLHRMDMCAEMKLTHAYDVIIFEMFSYLHTTGECVALRLRLTKRRMLHSLELGKNSKTQPNVW